MSQAIDSTCKPLDATIIVGDHTLLVGKSVSNCAKCGSAESGTKNIEPVCEICGTEWHFVATTYSYSGDDTLALTRLDMARHPRFSVLRFIGTATGWGEDFKVYELFVA